MQGAQEEGLKMLCGLVENERDIEKFLELVHEIDKLVPTMDKPHKQVVTVYPLAIKKGQTRVHVRNPIPWHSKNEQIKCPKCEAVFIVDEGFQKLLRKLEAQHKNQEQHPDFIPSDPNWARLCECDCGR